MLPRYVAELFFTIKLHWFISSHTQSIYLYSAYALVDPTNRGIDT